jgi:hypothetical protein
MYFGKWLKFPIDGSSEPPSVRVRVEWVMLIAERVQPAWRWQGQGSFLLNSGPTLDEFGLWYERVGRDWTSDYGGRDTIAVAQRTNMTAQEDLSNLKARGSAEQNEYGGRGLQTCR